MILYIGGGRIYDLLNMKTSQFHRSRIIKCRCTKSKCSVKYCDCYANGEACGSSCECLSCLNLVYSSNSRKSEDRICRCSRSGCSKKYCECFQRGDSCSSKCQCTNCHNSSGSGLRNQFWYHYIMTSLCGLSASGSSGQALYFCNRWRTWDFNNHCDLSLAWRRPMMRRTVSYDYNETHSYSNSI